MSSIARHHAEWLSLVPASGPFLSMEVLVAAFPQGLDETERDRRHRLRAAHDEWLEGSGDPEIHRAFVRFVLREALDLDDAILVDGPDVLAKSAVKVPQYGETLRPDLALLDPDSRKPRLLLRIVPPDQGLESPLRGRHWKAAPATRMMTLLHGAGCPLGLVTNGDHWMLVHAPVGETATFASFHAHLFFEEPLVLRAFTSLLGARRFFGVPDDETLAGLLDRSAQTQQEVTDQLGLQVRQAVEILIRRIDAIDRGSGGDLLRGVDETRLYEAAVTVMMRLVFLFAAEDRELLPVGEELYLENYAVSTIREQLQTQADRHGPEVLERRRDAWVRLLATFRAVHGGIRHDRLRLPAYGGSLFDPDRFPFLEGRPRDSRWREEPARPLDIDNRTVLELLSALQVLQVKVPGGGPPEPRRVSFLALGVEQIGHVYEGLLDHTAKRASAVVIGLKATKGRSAEVEVPVLEEHRAKGTKPLVGFLRDRTGRSPKALERGVTEYEVDPDDERRFLVACENDPDLYERVKPWARLVRDDDRGNPVVFGEGSVFVTQGLERRVTGTHYTPRSLTEPVVRYTLEPLVYDGPAEGKDEAAWRLRSAREIMELKVCDMAMGSGAFLVQACRYLSERLVEAWELAEMDAGDRLVVTPEGDLSSGDSSERPLPASPEERLALARRFVADRCLYGVDKNPMAVEMAKLSLWLVTLHKDRPFSFVDHALRCGDSLIGVTDPAQIERFHLDTTAGKQLPFVALKTREALARAVELRKRLESFPVLSPRDAEEKVRLLRQADAALGEARLVSDLVVGAAMSMASRGNKALEERLAQIESMLADAIGSDGDETAREQLRELAVGLLEGRRTEAHAERSTFHWPLEFPEVLVGGGGFSAFVGNPPFLGGQRITGVLGTDYRLLLVEHLAEGRRGSADLCAYFLLRASRLLRDSGQAGMLTTNTIAQGDTREVGLDRLTERGLSIPRAEASRKWPGTANLEIAQVWLRRGEWRGAHVLGDETVSGITSYLARPGAVRGKPFRLAANAGKSFQGSIVLGMGFVMSPEEAEELIERDPHNRDVLFPYLNGKDLNSRPDQSPSRWVINFSDWPLDGESAPAGYDGPVAAEYPDCLSIVREKVKPERDRNKMKHRRELWWQFGARAPTLYATIEGMEQVLVVSLVNNHLGFGRVPRPQVFAHKLAVFPLETRAEFALLQSSAHYHWAWHLSSTMRRDINYSPTDCFETFPFPRDLSKLEEIGREYESHRAHIMAARGEGLTKTYNRFHNSGEHADDIRELRDHGVEMDLAVARSYGWDDLPLDHDFQKTNQGIRFTISERARREVLDRLLELNHQRHTEEAEQGLHEKRAAKSARKRKSTGQASFAFTESLPPATGPAEAVLEALRDSGRSLAKSEILAVTGFPDSAWPALIRSLTAGGRVVRVGRGRGIRYAIPDQPQESKE